MKLLFLILACMPVLAFSQSKVDGANYNYAKNMEVKVEQEPHYPDGEMKFYEYVFTKLNYSQEVIDAKVNGEVLINFTVNADSTLTDFSVVKKVGYGIEDDIIDILKTMKFAPGIRNGKPVDKNLLMSFPIAAE